jgi:hypothetical protein
MEVEPKCFCIRNTHARFMPVVFRLKFCNQMTGYVYGSLDTSLADNASYKELKHDS